MNAPVDSVYSSARSATPGALPRRPVRSNGWGILLIGIGTLLGLAGGIAWWLTRPTYDLLIVNGTVVDGSGDSARVANVAVSGGKIVAVGRLWGAEAAQTIDATGLVVAPGFIDVHTHVEASFPSGPNPFRAPNFVRQGVTTLITGNCGSSSLHLGEVFDQIDRNGSTVNVASFVGHNSVRKEVMDRARRVPTPAEQRQMDSLVAQAMKDGALGLSTGLAYVPGAYAGSDEVVALARVVARDSGMYVSHIRNEAAEGMAALREALDIGLAAHVPVHISHFKASGKGQWGRVGERLTLLDSARSAGLTVSIDQYPYTASSTSLDLMLPDWALEGDGGARRARLADPAMRARIVADMKDKLAANGWSDYAFARVVAYPPDTSFNGLTVAQIARRRLTQIRSSENATTARRDTTRRLKPLPDTPVQRATSSALETQIETILAMIARGGAQMIYFDMSEADMEAVMRLPGTMFGTDSSVRSDNTTAKPHPRGLGTFPRVISRYVAGRPDVLATAVATHLPFTPVLTLSGAVRKMSALPAETFGLAERGRIAPGYWADLVLFDRTTIQDEATYDAPLRRPAGIHMVFVNGRMVLHNGTFTSEVPGKALRHRTNRSSDMR